MSAPFEWPVRVYIEDTDVGGIVFYANYFKYMERARTEFLRSKEIALRSHIQQEINYVVHSLEARYVLPAKLDDQLLITARVEKLGRTYVVFSQQVLRAANQQLLVDAQVKVACTTLNEGKPRPFPNDVSAAFRSMIEAEQEL